MTPDSESAPANDKPQLSVIDISKTARKKLRARRYLEAKRLFMAGLAIEPENPYLLSGMGDACRETDDLAEAERCYQALLKVDHKNLFALRGLGDVCKKNGHHQEAIRLWEKYLRLRPQDKHVMTRIADSCKLLNQLDRAEQVYRRILKIAPEDRFALTGLADLQHRMGLDNLAISTYERVLEFDQNELHILTIIGKLCWRVADFERAEIYFRRALAVDPHNPYALYGLGNCYRWHRQYEEAIAIWQKILSTSEGTQTLHTRMGDAYFHLGKYVQAEGSYHDALGFGDDSFALTALICLYSVTGKFAQAAQVLEKMLKLENTQGEHVEFLVKRFKRAGQTEEMAALFQFLIDKGNTPAWLVDIFHQQSVADVDH